MEINTITLGAALAEVYGLQALLKAHHLQLDGHESEPLAVVVNAHESHVWLNRAIGLLLQSTEQRRDYSTMSTPALIEHVLVRYHNVHREQLTRLVALAQSVEQCPRALTEHLLSMQQALESHMQKEEQVLFALLARQPVPAMVAMPINVMLHEHDDHQQAISQLLALSNDTVCGVDGCENWQQLNLGIAEFVLDLYQHIEIENTELFLRR